MTNLYLALGVIGVIIGVFFYGRLVGIQGCERKVLVKTVTVSEMRNEIANNRPSDDAVFFAGLLDDSEVW